MTRKPKRPAACDTFLRQSALADAVGAAFQRVLIYGDHAADKDRKALRDHLVDELRQLESKYRSSVPSSEHCENIAALALTMSARHAGVLKDGHFRIGVAQKALNSYLKVLWCYGWIPEPPHCPVDSIVLAKVGDTQTKWTQMDGIEAYQAVIESIRKHIKRTTPGQSLSQWEVEVWNNR